ncbi:hypothetical protein [Pseudoalteromonas denitrificans]|uniref:LPP20 lipoprotein n=1 Tax=Pseudoalteromonas denitrificans DSM 6059 TaxID=1123010 RepID=A0A1I1FP15_9GAMM|nr:hypothetical protein [Pseudoalteromonas denitrificans]SFB98843.1 hypothetical protein SAMN02745724_00640 [Pseudoalteromonas denitrificans DSM 6059]
MKKTLLVTLLLFVTHNLFAQESHFREYVGASGTIDWTKASVEAIGYGISPAGKNPKVMPLLACRAAIVDAQRNLLESFQGVRVTSTTLVSNYALTSDIVKSSVEGTVQGAIIKSRINRADGSCKVVLQAPLKGKVSKSIYKNLNQKNLSTFNFKSIFSHIIGTAYASDIAASSLEDKLTILTKRVSEIETILDMKLAKEVISTDNAITGIVIDVRGSQFIPSLDPKIRKNTGDILYPDEKSTMEIIDSGQLVSLFATDVLFAMEHPIVGDTPLLIKANKTWKNNNTEITINEKDAKKLLYLSQNNTLKNTGVIIVLD